LWARHSDFEKAGLELVFVGNGAPNFIEGFADEFKITSPIVTDPTLKVFEIAGMKRGLTTVFSPRGIKNVLELRKEGHKQVGKHGDAWQQGGVVVVRPGNKVTYTYSSEVIGDHFDIDQLLKRF
jgi:hypothetical protein